MAIRVAINHKTHYRYDRLVNLSPHVFRLRPAVHSRTTIEAYSFKIKPEKHFLNWQQDPFGNFMARVVFPEPTRELAIEVEVIANLVVINPFDFFLDAYAEKFPFTYKSQLKAELAPYLEIREQGPLLMEWLQQVDLSKPMGTVDFLVEINRMVRRDINYSIRMEPGIQRCDETLGKQLGSCRDSAWLLVQILRHLGLASRFVSGYLVQLTADVKSLDGPSGPEADFTDLHAWTEVYIPGAGWVGMDPTSGLFAGEGHIPLACTPDPQSAAPVEGLSDPCEVDFRYANTVQRIHEDPRVTKPYTDQQWMLIQALGKKVDDDLVKHDVRLSMGGEPTFISIDDMQSAEWNTEADGKHKRQLAGNLLKRLQQTFAPGGMLHYGQGKWYPGEPLPRWQLGVHWRKDGKPIWKDPRWQANDQQNYGYDHLVGHQFLNHLALRLGVKTNHILPAYEDVFYFLWEEGKLPVNVDPLKADLKDPLERQTLTALLEAGLDTPKGYILPLKYHHGWRSSPWQFRRKHLFLIPGNSPIGLRLPLKSIPWQPPAEKDPVYERDLLQELPYLPDYQQELAKKVIGDAPALHSTAPKEDFLADTALCIEAREGQLFLFMPPATHLEHYLELVAAIEATAAELEIPVKLEGYEPPRDPRAEVIKVTPDPGVIEVNIHPALSWDQLADQVTKLYEQAYLSRLGTEKFMLDGKHSGTGGGNHVTVGGATPSDSPLLRRPDLLRSLITYWQHHPGLSYLFSSAFIGPTSQAPRVDEGRDDRLYELEIAFDQIPESGYVPYWLVDRLFRHLLTDITGNTHRSEFCIDKLYSPDSPSGRLGLLELRAFDMPPHARMSLVQMLLVRALIAMFWQKPYRHKLVRWGTELHDRFLLPHYVQEDLRDVVADLNDFGYPFQLNWFDPFFEFRFPLYGRINLRHIELEIRMAIEPWHVLGEEATSTGTARYVDSSLERLQIKISGLTEARYVVTCNGVRVPLRNTGVKGEYVAGVRYRAWQPPSALHPTIGIDSPLVFDIIDTWNGRSIGGCTYHVVHPGGRNYDNFPVNSFAAESRQISRFWDYGHTTGPLEVPPAVKRLSGYLEEGTIPIAMEPLAEEPNNEFPFTLDLRLTWSKKKKK